MNILYLSSHEILEADELRLLSDLGYNCFSLGAYTNSNKGSLMRGEIPNLYQDEKLKDFAINCSKENIDPRLVGWADIILVMHNAKTLNNEIEQSWIVSNWPLLKNKRTIWRSIGQSISSIEKELLYYKEQGLQIVRYSPKERNIPGYCGEDAIIRFYKDPEEFKGWTGEEKRVINFTQSLKQRGEHCGYETILKATEGFERKVYGTGNDDLGKINGGVLPYEQLKQELRENRVFFYFGTAPASYTLGFIEAWITGIPIVAAGKDFSYHLYQQDTNEIHDLIQNGINGFVANTIDELRGYIKLLMNDFETAKKIGEEGRKSAIAYFAKEKIASEWKEFLEK